MKITLNLLPQQKKEELRFKSRCHFMLKVAVLASTSVMVYVVFVFACLEIIGFQKKSMLEDNQKVSSNQIYKQIRSDQEVIKEYNKMAETIERGFSQRSNSLATFEKINEIVPQGISFDQVTIASPKVTIKGVGAQRQEVIAFKDKLQESGMFSKVDSPISNFTQEKDVSFQFNLELKTK